MSSIAYPAIGAKPCPFCGGVYLICEGDTEPGCWGVECMNDDCNASGPRGCATPKVAVEKWNAAGSVGDC